MLLHKALAICFPEKKRKRSCSFSWVSLHVSFLLPTPQSLRTTTTQFNDGNSVSVIEQLDCIITPGFPGKTSDSFYECSNFKNDNQGRFLPAVHRWVTSGTIKHQMQHVCSHIFTFLTEWQQTSLSLQNMSSAESASYWKLQVWKKKKKRVTQSIKWVTSVMLQNKSLELWISK